MNLTGYYLVATTMSVDRGLCVIIRYFKKSGQLCETWVNSRGVSCLLDQANPYWLHDCREDGDVVRRITKAQFYALSSVWSDVQPSK